MVAMFRWNRLSGGILFASLLCVSRTMHADTPISLLVRPKVGRIVHIKTVVKASFPAGALTVTQVEKNTLKSIKPNGDWTEEIIYESSVVSDGKEEQKQPLPPAFTVTHDKLNKLKEGRKQEAGGFIKPEVAKILETLNTFVLTDKAVAPNDAWETTFPNPAITDRPFTIKSTYLGVEKIDGKDAWKIKQTSEPVVDLNGGQLSYTATEWIDPKSGDKLKVEADIKNVPTQGGPMTEQVVATPTK